jgi:phosphoserine phosphatase RsbU/P
MNRILVVDDDSIFRLIVGTRLNDLGYVVSFATNGWEGLLSLDKQRSDLVIMDMVMPGMDGPTFLRILRNDVRRKGIPVIIVSSRDIADVKDSIGDNAVSGIIAKQLG